MKKLFLLVFIVSVVGVATAEVIDSVSFNPSRLGRYQHLKVSDKLDAGSVLTSQFVTVNASRQTTMNYGGTLPVTVTNAEVATLDMDDDTTLFTPSVHLIGGDTTVTGTTNVGTNVKDDSNAASVYATQLNLPNHTINVHGGGRLWDGENHISDKSFVLGGNNIPSPATGDCQSLGWFTRRDDITNRNFKVLGCTPYEPPASAGCDYNIGCASGYASFDSMEDPVSLDNCDGNPMSKYSGCTAADVAKGGCKDYYYIGSEEPVLTTTWNAGGRVYDSYTTLDRYNGTCRSDGLPTSNYDCPNNLLWNIRLSDAHGQSSSVMGLMDPAEACSIAYGIGSGSSYTPLSSTTNSCSVYYCKYAGRDGNGGLICGGSNYICFDIKLNCSVKGPIQKFAWRMINFTKK